MATATVQIKNGDLILQDAAIGDGPIDASFKAIDRITGIPGKLESYAIKAVTGGKDAMGEVNLKVTFNDKSVSGRGTSTDIIEGSVRAYLNALNRVAGFPPSKKQRKG